MAKKIQKLLKQMEMFDEMSKHGLSPNQYYLMCCIRDSVTPLRINMHLELRSLVVDGWIVKNTEGNRPYSLTPQSVTLIDQIEKLFSLKKTMTSRKLMGDEFKKNIQIYVEMFPNIKLPNGKAARAAFGNLEKNFRWFFENYKEYDWDLVLKASAYYVNEKQKKQWKFCRTSQYFIRKNQLSDLADYCEIIKTGGDYEEEKKHATRVV